MAIASSMVMISVSVPSTKALHRPVCGRDVYNSPSSDSVIWPAIRVSVNEVNSSTSSAIRGTETHVERPIEEADLPDNPGDNQNLGNDEDLARLTNTATVAAVQTSGSSHNRGLFRTGKTVVMDAYNGNTATFRLVRSCLVEVEFLSNQAALNAINLSGSTGPTVRDTFGTGAANAIFNDINSHTNPQR